MKYLKLEATNDKNNNKRECCKTVYFYEYYKKKKTRDIYFTKKEYIRQGEVPTESPGLWQLLSIATLTRTISTLGIVCKCPWNIYLYYMMILHLETSVKEAFCGS
jgi:hypothetical protein